MHRSDEPQRLLITGGAGFVGTGIVQAFRAIHPNWHITVLDSKAGSLYRAPSPASTNYPNQISTGEAKPDDLEYLSVDITVPTDVAKAINQAKPTCIIHAAGIVPAGLARYSRITEEHVTRVNVGGTKSMLEAARATASVRAFVYTSTCCVITDDLKHDYPNFGEETPIPPKALIYGETKAKAERLVLESSSTATAASFPFYTCAVRPSVVMGPGDAQLLPSVHACIAKGESNYLIGDGDNLYDFTYVDNIAWAHVLAAENLLGLPLSSRPSTAVPLAAEPRQAAPSPVPSAAGKAISVTNGAPITFRDFTLAVWVQFGHVPAWTLRIPSSVAWLAGLGSELVSGLTGAQTTLCRGSIKDAVGTRYADISRARALLGYEPVVDLDEGVRRACAAYKEKLAAEQAEKSSHDDEVGKVR